MVRFSPLEVSARITTCRINTHADSKELERPREENRVGFAKLDFHPRFLTIYPKIVSNLSLKGTSFRISYFGAMLTPEVD